MITIVSLWLPILLAAVLVFVASSVIHMVLGYHAKDFAGLPDEDAVQDALAPMSIPPGDYFLPHAGSMEVMRSEAFQAKVEKGPVAHVTVIPSSAVNNMGGQLAQWFFYCVLVGIVAAYVTGRTLGPGADYLAVFRLSGTVAFACYAMSLPQNSIWYHKNWPATLKSVFDGLVYAMLTAGAFGWLWPA